MYFITTKRMLELCFSAHPNIQYRTKKNWQAGEYHSGLPILFDDGCLNHSAYIYAVSCLSSSR